jgi:hypothetical protein
MKGLKFAHEHILMYEMAGDFTHKYFNYADPTRTFAYEFKIYELNMVPKH